MKSASKLEFFATKKLGSILHASPRAPERWRGHGKGPSYTRIGSALNAKLVSPNADVALWLSKNRPSVISRPKPAVLSPPNDDLSMVSGPVLDAEGSVVPQGRRSMSVCTKMLGVAALTAQAAARRATQWCGRGHE